MSQNEAILCAPPEPEEIWKNLDGKCLGYSVSNLGNVRSLERLIPHPRGGTRIWKGRILKKWSIPAGYLMVHLGKKRGSFLVHRLVASCFSDNPNLHPCVNHKNGIKHDNRAVNLEWCSYSQNERHSYDVLGKKPNKTGLGKTGIKSFSAKPVVRLGDGDVVVAVYGSASEAARELASTQGRISNSCRENTKHRGHHFRYINRDEYYKLRRRVEPNGQLVMI